MMLYWKDYKQHMGVIIGKKKKVDNNIYTFDIETSSYLIKDGKQICINDYESKYSDEYEYHSCMYVWQFGINDVVYYGRTWEELKEFMNKINESVPEKKILFIHNLSFEFQYLQSVFTITEVKARVSRKVMSCFIPEFNFELHCSYMMSNVKLAKLSSVYKLPVQKMEGDLDYSIVHLSTTPLTEKELGYCENDCLVLYHYIKRELEEYEVVDKIPLTSTGKVRRELKSLVLKDNSYRNKVYRAINTDPHVYNMLVKAFQGGYTHANYIYTDEVIENVISFDFTSSYPYVMVSHKYPSTEFKKCYIKTISDMVKDFAYLLKIKFKNIKSKYYNNFISKSKCEEIVNGKYDNGRVISADEFIMTITDVDFRLYLQAYDFEYEIIESYFSKYNYLPKQFINFILQKYVNKTEYKDVEGKEILYNLEKAKFNSLYGMSVTNTIRDKVEYINGFWVETPLSNDEIEKDLIDERKKCFLSFAYGVWVTAYARNNLIKNAMKLDDYTIYMDTDSLKLAPGFDINVINEYNKFVENKIKFVSKILDIPIEKFAPKDIKGNDHMLGLFDKDAEYLEFITQGAKKYCFKKLDKNGIPKIGITVAGVPKSGAKILNSVNEFRDNLLFPSSITKKQMLTYIDYQEDHKAIDYLGNEELVTDKSGCCFTPASYVLGKALEYVELLTENSSARSVYREII